MDLINYIISKLYDSPDYKKTSLSNHGELLACRYLKRNGYKIIEKNYRSRFGEIDIIAKESGVICFIEVKSRMSTAYGLPEEHVDMRKQKKLQITSMFYILENGWSDTDMRFDVISVDLKNSSCRNIRNAFDNDL